MPLLTCAPGNDREYGREAWDGSVPGVRRVVGLVAIFGLFLAFQVGSSVVDHDHATILDGIECVACHVVRVAPPTPQPVAGADAATEIAVAPSTAPETPPARIVLAPADLPRGPPEA